MTLHIQLRDIAYSYRDDVGSRKFSNFRTAELIKPERKNKPRLYAYRHIHDPETPSSPGQAAPVKIRD